MRLIDADAYIEEALSRIDPQDMYLPIHIKVMVLDKMPTIDAVPVIRCKDCKHACKCYGDVIWASKGGGYIHKSLGTNGFCSRAERKEE